MSVAVPVLAEMVALTYRDRKNPPTIAGQQLPAHWVYPSEILAVAIVFGGAALMDGTSWQPVGTAIAWAFVVATALSIWSPAAPLGAKAGNTPTPQGGTSSNPAITGRAS